MSLGKTIPFLVVLFLIPLILILSNNEDDSYISTSNDAFGASGNVTESIKFDDGFYQKIQDITNDELNKGATGASSSNPRYYDVIIVVSRDDGDARNPDDVARENKDAIVKRLKLINATNIDPAETLSFVTASIPVGNIIDFAQSGEVYKLGDGELQISSEMDTARQTIHATTNELRWNGLVLNGTGVVVSVLDTGIDHQSLNDKVRENVLCGESSCNSIQHMSGTSIKHGTPVSSPITLSSNVLSLTVNATDIENDKITIGVLPDTIPIDSVSLSAQQNNTSIISLNATGLDAGTYSFWIILSDDQDNHEREPYAVIVS